MKNYFSPLLVFVFLLQLCSHPAIANDNRDVRTALTSMNKALAHRKQAIKKKDMRMESLKSALDTLEGNEKLKALQDIAFKYTAINVDSALRYFSIAEAYAKETGNESARKQFEANRLSMYTFRGDLYHASQLYEQIDTTGMTKEDLLEFYAAGSRLYLAFAGYVTPDQAGSFLQKGIRCAGRHLELSEKDTPQYNYVEAILSMFDNRLARARALAADALERLPAESIYRTWCEELLGSVSIQENKKDEAIVHFANAVRNDALQGFQIGNGARLLTNLMISKGDFKQADKLLQTALDNAVGSGDRMRFSQAVTLSPEITEQYRGNNYTAQIIICILAILLAGAIGWGIWLTSRRKKNRKVIDCLHKKLVDAGAEKAMYIREFLNMSAMYLERMEEYKIATQNKIRAGKMEQVISSLKSGEIFQSQSETFYTIFDRAFLQAYPNFLQEVNALIQPDKHLSQPSPDRLTTDLRLLAFMRLDFDDSTLISRFMGLSLNTIYTYRNRIRSKALNRDTFERDITKIGCSFDTK